jgi:Tfp pilus assembly protein PilN
MAEFNLLPDVKMQYLRTKRLEHLVVTASVIVGSISLAVFLFLFVYVDLIQHSSINSLDNQINSSKSTLVSNKDLNEVLTIQNQLKSLPQLEAQTPTVSRLFTYITNLTPVNVTISSLNISFTANTISITGAADTLSTVNTYVDTLKYATYSNLTDNTKNNQAFNAVILSSFNYDNSQTSGSQAQYSITCNFDPALFNSSNNVTLQVPTEITTRSILNQPALFKSNKSS